MAKIKIIRSVSELRKNINAWKAEGQSVGLVPTMGALHKGHLSLVSKIATKTDKIVATIFVNPKQFGEGEDFDRYPKDEAGDCEKLEQMGADAVFIPDGASIYPEGFATNIKVAGLGDGLCGAARPGHFDGVSTIVAKLLIQAMPNVAIFGEKDFQQLAVIKRLTSDLDLPVEIISGEIIREESGLALSSRNAYLNAKQLDIAVELSKGLKHAIKRAKAGESLRTIEADGIKNLLNSGFNKVDYFSFVDAANLTPVDSLDQPTRVLAAAFIDKTRLIDNFAVN